MTEDERDEQIAAAVAAQYGADLKSVDAVGFDQKTPDGVMPFGAFINLPGGDQQHVVGAFVDGVVHHGASAALGALMPRVADLAPVDVARLVGELQLDADTGTAIVRADQLAHINAEWRQHVTLPSEMRMGDTRIITYWVSTGGETPLLRSTLTIEPSGTYRISYADIWSYLQ